MPYTKEPIRYTFLILIIFFILIYFFFIINPEVISVADDESPIYEIFLTENMQRDIWQLCEEKEFSYELVLSIYGVEGFRDIKQDDIKSNIENLAYYRDYWAKQGYPDEIVFDLILISRLRGIEGGETFMKNRDSYDLNDYVQEVAEYKYYLEQSLDDI